MVFLYIHNQYFFTLILNVRNLIIPKNVYTRLSFVGQGFIWGGNVIELRGNPPSPFFKGGILEVPL